MLTPSEGQGRGGRRSVRQRDDRAEAAKSRPLEKILQALQEIPEPARWLSKTSAHSITRLEPPSLLERLKHVEVSLVVWLDGCCVAAPRVQVQKELSAALGHGREACLLQFVVWGTGRGPQQPATPGQHLDQSLSHPRVCNLGIPFALVGILFA